MKQAEPFDTIVCESCGKEFGCGARAGHCWCADLELTAAVLAELQRNFGRCLCADCLRRLNAEEKQPGQEKL